MKSNMVNKFLCITTSLFIFFFLLISNCYAHYPWIIVSNYNPDLGEPIRVLVGWGHRFPIDDFLNPSSIESLKVLNTRTKKSTSILGPDVIIKTDFTSTPGTYIIYGFRKPGFYTKTYEGGKRQSKKGLSNVIKCYYSNMYMKSIVNVGKSKGEVNKKIGQKLEIIPLKNPINLKVGDYFPIKVLFKNKPYKGMVYSTYMGFSCEKNVFAYTTSTDWSGNAKIKIIHPGIWMVKVANEEPYKDKEVCDVESYVSTLTFEVK